MFIEDILGFHTINALEKNVQWRLYRTQRHGIKRLRFGNIITDIVYEEGKVMVSSNDPFTLIINNKEFQIKKGAQDINLS